MKSRDIVEIENQSIGGKSFVEGKAKLIKPIEGKNIAGYEYWQVEFIDQKGEYFNRIVRVS